MARVSSRRKRRVSQKFKLRKPVWIDPYPAIPGTEPEKRLFEVLVRKHIYFLFQGDLSELHDQKKLPVLRQPGFKPDFVMPEYKVILDPFGVYHHSLPGSFESDSIKSVVYRALGYAFYHPWWSERGFEWVNSQAWFTRGIHGHKGDVLKAWRVKKSGDIQRKEALSGGSLTPFGMDAVGVIDMIPEFHQGIKFPLRNDVDIEAKRKVGYRLGKNIGLGSTSVALANRKRRKPPRIGLRQRGRSRRRRR